MHNRPARACAGSLGAGGSAGLWLLRGDPGLSCAGRRRGGSPQGAVRPRARAGPRPLASSILTSSCLSIAPKFDPRAVGVTLGLIAVPGFPAFLKLALSMIPKPKDGGGA